MISVLIPTKNGGDDLPRCLAAVWRQRLDEDVEVIVVDSGSSDGSAERARESGARVYEIRSEEFGHGRTRVLAASLAAGDLLVFTSQDAVAENDDWLATLAAAARAGDDVAGAYGRQLPHPDARPPERFFLDFMYGADGRVQRLADRQEPTFRETIFSNVNSAIRADVLAAHPFNPDVTMSEDQEWSRRVLEAGLALVYEPAAAVRHSHSYSLRQAFARFRASGASARASYAPTPAGRRALSAAGRQYAREELHWLWTTSQRRWIPYAIVYELSKYAGLQVGLRGRGRPAPGDG